MFSEAEGELRWQKESFSEKVRDSFGQSIINHIYEPFGREVNLLAMAAEEAELKRTEIMALTMELRTIL